MRIRISQLEDLSFEDDLEVGGVTLNVVERGEWVHKHKTQSRKIIFTDGERNFCGYISRSGSPYTDWTYESEYSGDCDADIMEVEKVEVVTYQWRAKTEGASV